MGYKLISIRKAMLAALGSVFLISCAAVPTPSMAQSGTNIRVLVMGEDSDPRSVKRTSRIFKRVLAELNGGMQRQGFRMVDEEMLAVDLGWAITERRPKTELIEAAKLANSSGNATHHVRALVIFSIYAYKRDLNFANRISTQLDGEIYDVKNNQFLGAFELPRATYPAPADCSAACISEVVGDKAREVAMSLGDVLGKKLVFLSPDRGAVGTAAVPGSTFPGQGMVTTYTVTFRHFNTGEVLEVVEVMSEEFPGYWSHNLLQKTSAVRRYEYVTTAKATKLEKWFNILLMDMGLSPDKKVEIILNGTEFILDKIVTPPARNVPVSTGRFQ